MGSDPCTPPELLPDTAHSKVVMGIRGYMLGFVFLALGLGFCLCKKVKKGPEGCVPPPPEHLCCLRGSQLSVTPFSLPTELLTQQRLQPLPVASDPARPPRFVHTLLFEVLSVPPSPGVTLPLPSSSQCSQ